MRALIASIALSVVACKGKAEQKPAPGSGSAVAEVQIDWAKCDQALAQAATAPLDARPQIVLDGCQVCGGDWQPLLDWNVDPASGGPKREQIEQRMVACKAFCTGDSKLKFIASVDKVRGQSVNTPWRQLATACKERVNGSSDDRFMSAPFFALDRIARAAAAHGSDKLAAIELPLPALTVSGTGVMLPDAEGVVPSVGPIQIKVLGDKIHVGKLPRG